MAIIDWADINRRYPETVKYADATQADSAWVTYAVAELEGRLASGFAIPFSSNNLTARDLAIDLTFAKTFRFKDMDKSAAVSSYVGGQIEALLSGRQSMILADGSVMASAGRGAIYVNAEHHPIFGLGPTEYAVVSSAELVEEQSARGIY